MEKTSFSLDSSHNAYSQYPGPPEYVEQSFSAQPGHPPPVAMQTSVMPMQQYGGAATYGVPNPAYPPPVVQQPTNPYVVSEGYLQNPPPPGYGNGDTSHALGFLSTATKLQIRQKFEIMEMITGFETENKYTILNDAGQPVFYAIEQSDCCARQCCGPARPMEIRIFDLFQNEVLHLNRPLACQSVCCFCCLQTMEITSPPGRLVSTIEQQPSLWPSFDVFDHTHNKVLEIEGPFCTFSCGGDVKYSVNSLQDGTEIGSICKKWGGFLAEAFTDADNFTVTFPSDLSVHCKMGLLGAVFLIDMMYYESSQKK